MSLLPKTITTLDANCRPLPRGSWFERIDGHSDEAKGLSEADWDEIICANVGALTDALCAADLLPEDSTLRVLGCQIDSVDVLLVEVPLSDGSATDATDWGEPRRLVLLEDKLVRNSDAKRQVLAQVLDYSQRAQRQWTTKSLCSNRRLAPHVKWLTAHASRLDVMMTEGDFLLVVAGDDIDDDLLRLARRFAAGNDPLSLNDLCLVSLALYRRGDERLIVPHVVSAVERHQRQVTIRVVVQDTDGKRVPARAERDVDADVDASRRGALPMNADVEAFLRRAKALLDPKLLGTKSPYVVTGKVRKALEYTAEDEHGGIVRLKIHFGGYERDLWSPIEVGLQVESPGRDVWRTRIEKALTEGTLPAGTKLIVGGKKTVTASKPYRWSAPAELTDALLTDVCETLVRFEAVLGARRTR